ncbi:MAG: aminotransferase class I/II-fold pyridoxal phosphate-dependent enzyme [Verrucomicrobia bacterium]|nr:aminotransferase class I/II-fold pyridoxal phosphate-dependent enzyme [Verrucomicrobiota bacterium]
MSGKTRVSDLAINGARPAYVSPLHVGCPNIGNRETFLRCINEVLDRRWLTNGGECVQEFEQRLSKLLGVRHCIAICNGTVALELATRALGLQGEVIVPSFTFVATAHALQWQGITPVFCDVDPHTHTLDPRKVEPMITPRTTGIIGVHVWGQACAIEALTEIAQRRSLKLMFDAAHAFGCTHNGRMIGSFGEAEVFSFHATKVFNTLEGGAIATNNDELARKIRLMKNFGFTDYDRVDYIGTNGKMNEISAAMGLTNLESLDEFMAVNRRNHETYRRELAGIPGLSLFVYNQKERNNHQYVVVEVDAEKAGLSRNNLVRILHAENILARRYFHPACHRMEPYRSCFPHAGLLLPETERLSEHIMCLPTGTAVSENDIATVCSIIRLAIRHAKELTKHVS